MGFDFAWGIPSTMAATSPHSGWTFGERHIDSSATPPSAAMPAPSPAPGPADPRPQDPFNRLYRAPLARLLTRPLVKTPIAPEHVALVQPFLAAVAGYFLTFADVRHLALAVLLFEARA